MPDGLSEMGPTIAKLGVFLSSDSLCVESHFHCFVTDELFRVKMKNCKYIVISEIHIFGSKYFYIL